MVKELGIGGARRMRRAGETRKPQGEDHSVFVEEGGVPGNVMFVRYLPVYNSNICWIGMSKGGG